MNNMTLKITSWTWSLVFNWSNFYFFCILLACNDSDPTITATPKQSIKLKLYLYICLFWWLMCSSVFNILWLLLKCLLWTHWSPGMLTSLESGACTSGDSSSWGGHLEDEPRQRKSVLEVFSLVAKWEHSVNTRTSAVWFTCVQHHGPALDVHSSSSLFRFQQLHDRLRGQDTHWLTDL